MQIQLNTDNNITGTDRLHAYLEENISGSLDRFSEHITRIEVHLTDENSHKDGQDDKRCMLEARLSGMKPIAVTNTASNIDDAVDGAITKLKTSLDTVIGKLRGR